MLSNAPRGLCQRRVGRIGEVGRMLAVAVPCLLAHTACDEPPSQPPGETVATVGKADFTLEVVASASVTPEVGAEVRVGPRISGVLQRLHTRVGSKVRRGELLAELEPAGLEAAVRAAQGDVGEAEARVSAAAMRQRRLQTLVAGGLDSQESLDLAAIESRGSAAALESALARLAIAQLNRSYAQIVAPIGGTVTSVSTQEGETVAASFAVPTFLTIVDLDRLQLEVYVDEVDVGRVSPGQSVSFEVDAFPDEEFTGVVRALVPQPVQRGTLVSYVVIVDILSPERSQLRPLMTATARIAAGKMMDILTIPRRAVRRDATGQAYAIVVVNGVPTNREVIVGHEQGELVAVTAGLSEGDTIMLPALERGEVPSEK